MPPCGHRIAHRSGVFAPGVDSPPQHVGLARQLAGNESVALEQAAITCVPHEAGQSCKAELRAARRRTPDTRSLDTR